MADFHHESLTTTMQQPIRTPALPIPPVAKPAASTGGNLLAGLPFAPTAAGGMTESQKRSKMSPVSNGLRVMHVLLVAHAGLFADAFAGSLSKLANRVEVQRCDPDDLETCAPAAAPTLVVLDIDALAGEATTRAGNAQQRFAPATVVALGTPLDDNFIAMVLGGGVKAYLPMS